MPPLIYGDGTQTRDFTFIEDVVQATLLAAEKDNVVGEVFNVGYGGTTSINKIAKKVIQLFGKEGEIAPEYKSSYLGDFPHTQADITKARELLGYEPKIDFQVGIKQVENWLRKEKYISK